MNPKLVEVGHSDRQTLEGFPVVVSPWRREDEADEVPEGCPLCGEDHRPDPPDA